MSLFRSAFHLRIFSVARAATAAAAALRLLLAAGKNIDASSSAAASARGESGEECDETADSWVGLCGVGTAFGTNVTDV